MATGCEDAEAQNLIPDNFVPVNEKWLAEGINSVIVWLKSSKHRNKYEIAERSLKNAMLGEQTRILAYFSEYVGGKGFISSDDAWKQACRQREFVKEAAARLAELPDGTPTELSEAIRDIPTGEKVKVIADPTRKLTGN